MNADELRLVREEEIGRLRALRSALVPLLIQPDERQRRGAARRLRRVDGMIRRYSREPEGEKEAGS